MYISQRILFTALAVVIFIGFIRADEVALPKWFTKIPKNEYVGISERTFLEKIMLLHEEFAKSISEVRTGRMSRHLYDVERMMRTDIMEHALTDEQLYRSVVEHRRKFIGLKGFDYDTLYPKTLSLNIPSDVLPLWRQDYEKMQRSMIYSESLSFDELIARIQELNKRINQLPYCIRKE